MNTVGNVAAIRAPDKAQMLDHLMLLFGRAMTGRIEITGIKVTQDGERVSPRTHFFNTDQLDEAADYAADLNSEPMWNVYVGAATRDPDVFPGKAATDDDFHRAWAIHADIDDAHDLPAVRAKYRDLGIVPPFVVITGRTPTTRAQLWWPLEEPISDREVYRQTLRGVAAALHTDPSVTAAKQLMRLAGGLNWPKKGDRKLEPTETTQPDGAMAAFSIEQIHRAFPPADVGTVGGAIPEVTIGQGGVFGMEEKVMDGREGYAFRLIRAHLHEFMGTTGAEPSADELYRSVAPVYLRKVDQVRPGRGPEFLKRKCDEALRTFREGHIPFMRDLDEAVVSWAERVREHGSPPAVHDVEEDEDDEFAPSPKADYDLFEVLSIADLRALPDAEWTVEEVIPRGGLGFIYGAPGCFKTFVCCDLGLHMAYKRTEWMAKPLKHGGSVLYLANEGAAGLKNRITAWQRQNGYEEDTSDFRVIRKAMSFMDAGDVERLERTVAAVVAASGPVDTIFVDTVSRVLPGADENLQKDMTIFVAACDRLREAFGATVIGVHHTNKNGDMRGSTVFLGQGDFIMRVDKLESRTGGTLTCEKQKEAEDGWKRSFSIEEHTWTPTGSIKPTKSLAAVFGAADVPGPVGPSWPQRDVLRAFQNDIQNAFLSGKPLQTASIAKREGRHAITRLAQAHSVPAAVVQDIVETWLNHDVLGVEVADTHTKTRGLKVLKWLD
jgi:hypothetical protein